MKVTLDNGPITVGDPLTSASSTPGYAMKATRAGKILGYALEAFDATTTGAATPGVDGETPGVNETTILAFIHLDELGGDLSVYQNEQGLLTVSAYTDTGKKNLFSLDEAGYLVVDKIKTQELCVGSVCVTEADFLRVFGASLMGSEEVGLPDGSPTSTSPVTVPDLPNSVIDSGPEAITTSTEATFFFHSTKDNSVFSCQIDAETWIGCESPKAYSGLLVGNHQFSVMAMEPTGEAEPSPSIYMWEIIAPTIVEISTTTESATTTP